MKRMAPLKHRIAHQGVPNRSHGTLRDVGIYHTPEEIPLMRIQIYPGVITYEDAQALVTSDGAPVMATGKGTFGQLYAVGRK
jgi:hypothetical protein